MKHGIVFPWLYLFLLLYLISEEILKFFLRFSFFEMKISILSIFRFFVFYVNFLLTLSFPSDWKKNLNSLSWIFIAYFRVLFLQLVFLIQLDIFYVVSFGLLLFLPLVKFNHGYLCFFLSNFVSQQILIVLPLT